MALYMIPWLALWYVTVAVVYRAPALIPLMFGIGIVLALVSAFMKVRLAPLGIFVMSLAAIAVASVVMFAINPFRAPSGIHDVTVMFSSFTATYSVVALFIPDKIYNAKKKSQTQSASSAQGVQNNDHIVPEAPIVVDASGKPFSIPTTKERVVSTERRGVSPGVAAVLSFFIPGLGQLAQARVGAGIVFFALTVLGYAFFVVPGIIVHLWCIVNAARYNG